MSDISYNNFLSFFSKFFDCFNSSSSAENVQQFIDSIKIEFENDIIKRLNNYIEINLRVDFHSGLQLEKYNPFQTTNKINIIDRRDLIHLSPVKVFILMINNF